MSKYSIPMQGLIFLEIEADNLEDALENVENNLSLEMIKKTIDSEYSIEIHPDVCILKDRYYLHPKGQELTSGLDEEYALSLSDIEDPSIY